MVNGVLAERFPETVNALAAAGHEIVAHSWGMDVIPIYLDEDAETANIQRTLSALKKTTGFAPRGWISPRGTGSKSSNPDILLVPCKCKHAINRNTFEAQRHFRILDDRLAARRYMLGDTYTIVDMDVWGWARLIPTVMGEGAGDKFTNLKRLVDEISARPAAQRAVALKDNHKFKTEMDSEALDAMFPHMKQKVA